jgi:hypothetical protein
MKGNMLSSWKVIKAVKQNSFWTEEDTHLSLANGQASPAQIFFG